MRYSARKLLLTVTVSCLLAAAGSSQLFGQGGIGLDFNDPNDPRLAQIFSSGTAEVREDGGVDNTGYLKVTDANNGESGLIVLPDLSDPPGSALESFQITADLRVGAGTAQPADGFSFNLVRPEDPLLQEPPGAYASSPVGEANLPEEGSQTGLGIGFDEWQSGGADPEQNFPGTGQPGPWDPADGEPSCGPSASLQASIDAGRDRIEHDCIGISIRVDNELIAQAAFPQLNGELDNIYTLQTGPRGSVDDLGWAELRIQVTPDLTNENNSNIRITYKDREVINGSFAYKPSPGQLVFGGRTGGANSHHHIDNIRIITDFTRIELLGDFNEDGKLDLVDFGILADNMNTLIPENSYPSGDIDFSGRIDLADFVVFRKEFLKQGQAGAAAVPEPGAGLLAMLGALVLGTVRRRRRG